MSIVSFRRKRWSLRNFSENRKIRGNQSKDKLTRIRGYEEIFFLPLDNGGTLLVCLRSLFYITCVGEHFSIFQIKMVEELPCLYQPKARCNRKASPKKNPLIYFPHPPTAPLLTPAPFNPTPRSYQGFCFVRIIITDVLQTNFNNKH